MSILLNQIIISCPNDKGKIIAVRNNVQIKNTLLYPTTERALFDDVLEIEFYFVMKFKS